ncbi:FIP1[III]-like protein [Solanum pennellii]|uniref:FIP1[III]-like protein n=1 Tax=Solanum pennellii TaxID=28526 RepID=A0ABM1FNA4_SOLPN|nr:FIP1[III]-like protein [Solanum pennellii]
MVSIAGDDDDDFGDLYADVEVQASSAINALQSSMQVQTEVNEVDYNAAVGNCNRENAVRGEEDRESESGDDLNILLNDDEGDDDFLNAGCDEDEIEGNGGFIVSDKGNGLGQNSNGSGSGDGEKNSYKNTRPPQAAYSNHLKANGSSCAPSYCTTFVKGNWEDNSYTQRVGSGFAAQNGQSFSLPRSRNILDVNIDMFEKKPWRYPGSDLTDYFNFGFDEDSWKQYCNCLDEHREQAKKVFKDSDYKTPKISKPKGREIEVEESMIERLPSTDVERPQYRDSSVVIQIALQQSMEDPISSTKEQKEASENGDVGGDRKEFLCFSSACEDELASLEGTGEGSGNSTSGRNTPVCEHVSMGSDNNENSEFSDADERHHQEGTYCNVDQTSGAIKSTHDANKSSERDISDLRQPIKLQESLRGGSREHSPGSSCCSLSHGGTSGDGTFLNLEKSHDHQTRLISNAESELREKGTTDNQPISRTDHNRTKSGDLKYFTQGRRSVQRDLLHDRRRPGRMSEAIPAHLKDEDSHKSDARILYERRNSSVIRHRQRDRRYAFDSHEREDTSHFKRAEPFYSNAGRFSDYPCRGSFTKNPQMEYQLRCRYDKNWSGGRSVKRKLDHLELSIYTDDKLLERDRPHYGGRLTLQDMDDVSFHESEQWIDKYISYSDDENPSQRMRKIDQLPSKKRVRTDDLVTECNYIYDIMEETDNRYRPYNHRDTDILEDGYHVNLTYFRREIKSPSRGQRRDISPCKSSNDICFMDLKDEGERYDGYRPPSFRLYRESCTSSRRWQSLELPRGRNGIFSGTRKCDGGQFASLTNSIGANQTIKYPGNQDIFKRRRGGRQSEGMQWVEDENNSRYQENVFDAERTSYSFRRTSSDRRFKSFDNNYGPNPVEKLLDDRHVAQEKYKLIREGNNTNQFGQGSKVFHKDNHWRRFPRGRDSVDTDLIVENGESSGRCSKAGGVTSFDRYGHLDSDCYLELKPINGTSKLHFRETLRTRNVTTDPKENDKERLDIFSDANQEESLDIEEGQIIEEMNEKIVKKRITYSGKSEIGEMKNFATDKNVEGQGSPKLLEIMAKMEKRGERFKQPIALKSDTKNISTPLVDSFAVSTEPMQPRPARKRRWAASKATV